MHSKESWHCINLLSLSCILQVLDPRTLPPYGSQVTFMLTPAHCINFLLSSIQVTLTTDLISTLEREKQALMSAVPTPLKYKFTARLPTSHTVLPCILFPSVILQHFVFFSPFLECIFLRCDIKSSLSVFAGKHETGRGPVNQIYAAI